MAAIYDLTTFIALKSLERNIQNGKHIGELPADLIQAMLKQLEYDVCLNEKIEGDVAL